MSEKRELFSLEAEQGVLGAVLKAAAQQDLELVEEIVDAVCVEDFYFDDNAALFDVIADLHREGIPVDPVTVAQLRPTLPSDQRTLAYAGDLAVNVPSTANWRTYATHVRERSVLRKVVAAAGAVHELAHESRPVPEIVAQAQQALADLHASAMERAARAKDVQQQAEGEAQQADQQAQQVLQERTPAGADACAAASAAFDDELKREREL